MDSQPPTCKPPQPTVGCEARRAKVRAEEIVEFVRRNIEPLPPSPPYGERYCVGGTMTDGTGLPCIVVESAALTVDLAMRRFEESKSSTDLYMGYRAIVTMFVTKGNAINDYDLRDLAVSPYAIPLSRVREIG